EGHRLSPRPSFRPYVLPLGVQAPEGRHVPQSLRRQADAARRRLARAVLRQRLRRAAEVPAAVDAARERARGHARVLAVREPDPARPRRGRRPRARRLTMATPGDARANLLSRAEQELAAGRFAEAERDVVGALALDPDDPRALKLHAALLQRRGRIADAILALRRAAKRAPDDPLLLNSLGIALAASGDRDGAVAT